MAEEENRQMSRMVSGAVNLLRHLIQLGTGASSESGSHCTACTLTMALYTEGIWKRMGTFKEN